MKAKTARFVLLVLLFGFLTTHGWMITENGARGGQTNIGLRLSARSDAAASVTSTTHKPLEPRVLGPAPHPVRTAQGTEARAPEDFEGGGSPSSPQARVPVGPMNLSNGTPPGDLVGDLAFAGPTNLGAADTPPTRSADPPFPPGAATGNGGGSGTPFGGRGRPGVPSSGRDHPNVKTLSEPGSLALIFGGLCALALTRRRGKRRA